MQHYLSQVILNLNTNMRFKQYLNNNDNDIICSPAIHLVQTTHFPPSISIKTMNLKNGSN